MLKDQRGLLTRCYAMIFRLCLKTERQKKSPSLTALMGCCFFCCISEVKKENFRDVWIWSLYTDVAFFSQMQSLKHQI